MLVLGVLEMVSCSWQRRRDWVRRQSQVRRSWVRGMRSSLLGGPRERRHWRREPSSRNWAAQKSEETRETR